MKIKKFEQTHLSLIQNSKWCVFIVKNEESLNFKSHFDFQIITNIHKSPETVNENTSFEINVGYILNELFQNERER